MTEPPTFAELRDDMARTLQGTAPPGLTWERAQKMAAHLIEKYKTSRPRSEFTPIDEPLPSDTQPSTETLIEMPDNLACALDEGGRL